MALIRIWFNFLYQFWFQIFFHFFILQTQHEAYRIKFYISLPVMMSHKIYMTVSKLYILTTNPPKSLDDTEKCFLFLLVKSWGFRWGLWEEIRECLPNFVTSTTLPASWLHKMFKESDLSEILWFVAHFLVLDLKLSFNKLAINTFTELKLDEYFQ